jgi:hypothetical protein
MYDRLLQLLTRVVRVPPEPQPPFGAPGSVRIFRAGKNYYKLRLLSWGFAQIVALAAIVFWAVILIDVEAAVRERKARGGPVPPLTAENFAQTVANTTLPQNPPPAPDGSAVSPPTTSTATPAGTASAEPANPAEPPANTKKKFRGPRIRINGFDGFKQALVQLGLRLPDWAFPLIWFLKISGFVLYLVQIPATYAMRRLDFEFRWYIVTDRSLRIRSGLMRLQESTMSFANLQQVEVKQNPIQRLLGLADVHVQSAGGGGDQMTEHGKNHDSLHTGVFHCVENATEIRDLILERLRLFRQAGLGDPDDHHHEPLPRDAVPPSVEIIPAHTDTLAAAQEVLAEARALRRALVEK